LQTAYYMLSSKKISPISSSNRIGRMPQPANPPLILILSHLHKV
jgi:hypothetical protein